MLRNLGNHINELVKADGTVILYSYNTPVAANVNGAFYRTSKKWSVTTSKHINQWLSGARADERPQSYFDALA